MLGVKCAMTKFFSLGQTGASLLYSRVNWPKRCPRVMARARTWEERRGRAKGESESRLRVLGGKLCERKRDCEGGALEKCVHEGMRELEQE